VSLDARLLLYQCQETKIFSERRGLWMERTTGIDVGIVTINN